MILTFHQIEVQCSHHIYGVTVESLSRHLAILQEYSAMSRLSVDFSVTFDDGHISNYRHALPLLEARRMRAIFFVPAGLVETRSEVMTWSQLREAVSLGHEVASHTWSHPFLSDCDPSQLDEELSYSRQTLENKLGVRVNAISMPHGRWNHRIILACKNAGYERVYTSDFWRPVKVLSGIDVIGRLTVRRAMTSAGVARFMNAKGTSLWKAAAPYIAKNMIRGVIGDRLYHDLWRRIFAETGVVAASDRSIS